QTSVESLRRMDVSVRLADAPEDSSLATVTGFYGSAIGAAGGTDLPWTGSGAPGGGGPNGPTDEGGVDDGGGNADGGDNTPEPAPEEAIE
ncbi:MAG: hypothetical protein ACR2I8_04700, partial [Steroidobacteraceae bacterium]